MPTHYMLARLHSYLPKVSTTYKAVRAEGQIQKGLRYKSVGQ